MPRLTNEMIDALLRLWEQAYGRDNGGALVIQRFLLSLYNGRRFQFDLTDFRRLDAGNFEACLQVLQSEWPVPSCEVHVQLAILTGKDEGWMGFVFEQWGYDQGLPGRCKKAALESLRLQLKAQATARAVTA